MNKILINGYSIIIKYQEVFSMAALGYVLLILGFGSLLLKAFG